MVTSEKNVRPIAVFDSGMGGISVLKKLYELMPYENYLFYGDSAHAPYGRRSTEEVYELTRRCFTYFLEQNAKAVVLACNSATSAAAARLRARYPDIPIIGLEPAVKPAVLYDYGLPDNVTRRILVMATPLTLREHKFLELVSHYRQDAEILPLPAPELVEYVEQDKIDSPEMKAYLSELLRPYAAHPVNGVVLGCTHFPFTASVIRQILGEQVVLFDGAAGAARELHRQLEKKSLLADPCASGSIIFENSDPSGFHEALSQRLFQTPCLL